MDLEKINKDCVDDLDDLDDKSSVHSPSQNLTNFFKLSNIKYPPIDMDKIESIAKIASLPCFKFNTWNNSIELTVKEIGEQCRAYKLMHTYAAQKASWNNSFFMYSGIVLGPLSGLLSGIDISTTNQDCNQPSGFIITAAILAFISGIIVTVAKVSKFDQVSIANKVVASRYDSLEGNIRRQLSLYREDRADANVYLTWITKSYDNIHSGAPLISASVYNKFSEEFKSKGLVCPNNYSETIMVNNSNSEDKGSINVIRNKKEEVEEIEKIEGMKDLDDILIDIPLEKEEQTKDNSEETQDKKQELKSGTQEHRKSSIFINTQDYEMYDDGAMQYELKRLGMI